MRLAVYTDYAYHELDGHVYAERAFALFLARLAESFERLVVVGRLDPSPEGARYPLGDRIEFVALPYYESLARPAAAIGAMRGSLTAFRRALDGVDAVWLLGPHPLALAFAGAALRRRRKVALGVRQDLPAYVRSRHPQRRLLRAAAVALDASYRALSRLYPTIVVGPALARRYRRARDLLEISVSLISSGDLRAPESGVARSYDGERTVLSVGRIEREKNPLLLADVLAELERAEPGRWRLAVCGEGPMEAGLAERLAALELADRAELHGYVPFGEGLNALYRDAHAVLHVSLTEGLPQVLLEAFAAATPVVATDVGGVREAVGDAALVVPPASAEAAARGLIRVASDAALRTRLIRGGAAFVAARTAGVETRRVAGFLRRL